MSETTQVATPEQEAMAKAIEMAQRQAYEDIQKNAQLEIQIRGNSLGLAVNAHEAGTDPVEITKTAAVFLAFLKKGEVA